MAFGLVNNNVEQELANPSQRQTPKQAVPGVSLSGGDDPRARPAPESRTDSPLATEHSHGPAGASPCLRPAVCRVREGVEVSDGDRRAERVRG